MTGVSEVSPMRWPTGSWLGKYIRAIAWLMTTTFGLVASSSAVR